MSSASSTLQSGLNAPESVAFDSAGNLWVADEDNNRILEFASASLAQDNPSAILEIGQPAGPGQFNSSEGALTQTGLHAPVGLAFDAAGDLWASDRINNRVLEFKPPFADGMNASVEIGQLAGSTEFTSNSAETSQDGLSNPLGIAFDQAGNLWVADQVNSRIVEFEGSAPAATGVEASQSNGSSSSSEAPTGTPTPPAPSLLVPSILVALGIALVAAYSVVTIRRRRKGGVS